MNIEPQKSYSLEEARAIHPVQVELSGDRLCQLGDSSEEPESPPLSDGDSCDSTSFKTQKKKKRASSTSAATELISLVSSVELFLSDEGMAFATIMRNSHHETMPISSSSFSTFLRGKYYEEFQKTIGQQTLRDVQETLKAKAEFSGKVSTVNLRIAKYNSNVVIDLGNENFEVVRIEPGKGWKIVQLPEVKFRRPNTMKALTTPIVSHLSGDPLRALMEVLTINESHYKLIRAFIVCCLIPLPEYPILILQGGQGTAKSTTAETIKRLLDPQKPMLRALSPSIKDLAVAANGSHVLSFDNLSGLKNDMSDALCRLSTGSGFGSRKNYSDDEEVTFEHARPQILNGIDDIARRHDLQDRSINVTLNPITPKNRIAKSDYWKKFEEKEPYLLGGAYDLVSRVIAVLPEVELEESPRMADFAKVGQAIENVLEEEHGSFLQAYKENQNESLEWSIESEPLAQAVIALMEQVRVDGKTEETCAPTEMLERLNQTLKGEKPRGWPTLHNLKSKLERINPALRTQKISFTYKRERNRRLMTFQLIKME